MKLGYISMPETHLQLRSRERLSLANSLDFHLAYFPKTNPQDFVKASVPDGKTKVLLDAAAFGTLTPSETETAVRHTNDQLDGRLCLGVEICNLDATTRCKAQAQAFETLFSYDPRADQVLAAPSRYPMKPPCPEIIGLPVTGAPSESRLAAALGYAPMTPSWLTKNDVARTWPAIVAGATSAVRRARLCQWHVNRMVVVHDDAQTIDAYLYGTNSPIRRHFSELAQRGLIDGDIDRHLKHNVIAGSAQKVAEEILALREAVGDFGTLNIIDPLGGDTNMTKSTMIRLAEDVLPMVANSAVSEHKNLERT